MHKSKRVKSEVRQIINLLTESDTTVAPGIIESSGVGATLGEGPSISNSAIYDQSDSESVDCDYSESDIDAESETESVIREELAGWTAHFNISTAATNENKSTQKLLKRVLEEVKLGASSATVKRKKILPQKPFSEVHEFSEFEAKIQSSENKYNDLVAELQTIICASTTKFIKMAWRKIITDNVAQSYSWQGTKIKSPARALSVTGALKQTFYLKFPNVANDSEFERATINFFQHASTRLNKKVEYEKQQNTSLK